MKHGGVLSLKKFSSLNFLLANRLLILMFSALIIGVTISCLSFAGNSKAAHFSGELFSAYISDRRGAGFINILLTVFIKYFAVSVAFFVIGASIIGVVLSPVLCCSLGLYYGLLVSYTYSSFSFKGIAFNSIVLIPAAIIYSFCAFIAAKEAFKFSKLLLMLTLPKCRPLNVSSEFKVYCGKFIIVFLLSILAAFIDTVLSVVLLKYFSLS